MVQDKATYYSNLRHSLGGKNLMDSTLLHWWLARGDPDRAIGQCRHWGIMVATEALVHGEGKDIQDK